MRAMIGGGTSICLVNFRLSNSKRKSSFRRCHSVVAECEERIKIRGKMHQCDEKGVYLQNEIINLGYCVPLKCCIYGRSQIQDKRTRTGNGVHTC